MLFNHEPFARRALKLGQLLGGPYLLVKNTPSKPQHIFWLIIIVLTMLLILIVQNFATTFLHDFRDMWGALFIGMQDPT